jgi:hypothetical protein
MIRPAIRNPPEAANRAGLSLCGSFLLEAGNRTTKARQFTRKSIRASFPSEARKLSVLGIKLKRFLASLGMAPKKNNQDGHSTEDGLFRNH